MSWKDTALGFLVGLIIGVILTSESATTLIEKEYVHRTCAAIPATTKGSE